MTQRRPPDYEYAFMVETVTIQPGIADATADEVSHTIVGTFAPLVGKLGTNLPQLAGGGWQVVSHDLTRIDRHLILTFVIRRSSPRK